MMIRVGTDQTRTTGKSTKGTRVMELRDKDKGGFVDEIIFSAAYAELIDEEDDFDSMDTNQDGVIDLEE